MNKDTKKPSVKSKVEAVLFSAGHKISLDNISRLCRSTKEDVLAALNELKSEYDAKQSSLMLVEEGDYWKFTVRDHFIPIVKKIITETELPKTVLETLAVIAFKYPILQSDLIKIRTNKAYEHLDELESSGYITRQKHGRTNMIKLTDKFFKYFDLTEEKLKEKLQDFESIAKTIKEKEEEIERIKEEQRLRAEELKKQDEKIRKEIEALDESGEEFEVPLDVYDAKPKGEVQKQQITIIEKDTANQLEIVNEEVKEENQATSTEEPQVTVQDKADGINKTASIKKEKKKSKGIKLTPEMEKMVDKKVEEIVHGVNEGNK
ncbi:SMC-Scp complex subunit ScpB [Candidatus Woesearchaeota archaeon]|nr:SMC-Scp complex subunit ScpB [Candidatus Woesearchaeota archaeon]